MIKNRLWLTLKVEKVNQIYKECQSEFSGWIRVQLAEEGYKERKYHCSGSGG
jgi:hypothetical protein